MSTSKRVFYSESFKKQVVSSIESGTYNINTAKKIYNIKGAETIQIWLKKYGKDYLLPKRIRIETPDELSRIKELERDNKRLKEAFVKNHLKLLSLESAVEIAEKELGYSIEKKS